MGRQNDERRYTASRIIDPAESKTLSMRGRSMHENRETSEAPGRGTDLTGRSGKAGGRKPDTHVSEESDTGIVPMKGPNKSGQPEAEALEGRLVTKGKF